MSKRNPAQEGIDAAREDNRRARNTAHAVEEAADAEAATEIGRAADAGFDAGEFSGPAHDERLDAELDQIAARHEITREALDEALWNASHDDDGRWSNPEGDAQRTPEGELLDDDDERNDLAAKGVEQLTAELYALRAYIQSRRDDIFPADAKEEAESAEHLALYTAALKAAQAKAAAPISSAHLELDESLVEALAGSLDDSEKTMLLILEACRGTLPMLDLTGRWTKLGIIAENGTLSPLGRAIAQAILRDDPEAVELSNRAAEATEAAREALDDEGEN